jgi:precorrin-2 dehydrogenase/sirohydrochlorin ferrochelatase
MYPIHVDLSGKEVVVAGGGPVAFRKIRDLFMESTKITVVSPNAIKEIKDLHKQKKLTWISRNIRKDDYEKAFLIVAATNSRKVNGEIAAGVDENQLINVADQPELGNFIIPSVVKRGKLVLSVSTSGASPSLSISIKKELQQRYSEDYESYLEFLYDCRLFIKQKYSERHRKDLLKKLTDSMYLHDKEKRNVYKQALLKELDTTLVNENK